MDDDVLFLMLLLFVCGFALIVVPPSDPTNVVTSKSVGVGMVVVGTFFSIVLSEFVLIIPLTRRLFTGEKPNLKWEDKTLKRKILDDGGAVIYKDQLAKWRKLKRRIKGWMYDHNEFCSFITVLLFAVILITTLYISYYTYLFK
jgi:hypothetical protein